MQLFIYEKALPRLVFLQRRDVISFGTHRSVIFIRQTMLYCSRVSRERFLGLILLYCVKVYDE